MKTLIMYSYCELQKGLLCNTESKSNLNYFLENGLINNDDYMYCININGPYTVNFNLYLKKYPNLKIYEYNGKCQLEGYINILKYQDYKKFEFIFFMTDKIRGPYNLNFLNSNWIDYFNKYLINYPVIISSFGTSPWGKLYKLPYITMKFLGLHKKIFSFLIDNDFLLNNIYNTEIDHNKENPDYAVEIKLTYLLLNNNINYVSVDKNGVNDLNILHYYLKKNYEKLKKLTKTLHEYNDTTIINRIFWTGNTMRKIFEEKNNNFINKLKNRRDTSRLGCWY